jgi:hypothetical protein
MWSTKGQPTEIRLKRWLRKRDSVRAIDRVIDYFGDYRRSCEAERSAAPCASASLVVVRPCACASD